MKSIIIVSSLIVIFSCRPKQADSDADIYEFVNQVLAETAPIDNRMVCCIGDKALDLRLRSRKEDSVELLKMDTAFTMEDVSFMLDQAESVPDFKFKQEFIKGKRVIPLDTLKSSRQMTESFWKELKDRYATEEIATMSKPIFSRDKLKVIVIIDYYTARGGSGGMNLYRKENGKWKYSKALRFWDN